MKVRAHGVLSALFVIMTSSCGIDNPFGSDPFGDDDAEWADELLRSALDAPKPARSFESRKPAGTQCFSNFASFKAEARRVGRATEPGYQWHHIVNQNPANKKRFGTRLQCTDNLIRVPKKIHDAISGHYNSKDPESGMLVREAQAKGSWREQYEYGLNILREHGITP